MTDKVPAGPAPDPQERLTAIREQPLGQIGALDVLWLIEHVQELGADLTALRAERDGLLQQLEYAHAVFDDALKLKAELADGLARLEESPNPHEPSPLELQAAWKTAVDLGWNREELTFAAWLRARLAVSPQDQVIVYPGVGVSISHEPEGRLALPAWQAQLRDRMEKFLRGGDDSDQQGIDLGERVRGWLSLLPPPAAEGETP